MQGAASVTNLWVTVEDAFLKAAKSIGSPEWFRIYAHPGEPAPDDWSATTGRPPVEVTNVTEELRRAGAALLALAETLPLVVDKPSNVVEMLWACISDYDHSLWIEVRSLTENASVKLLISADNAVAFAQSRDFGDDDSDWARAARTRCVRKTVFGGLDLIEPGAIWFIEWLERQGAETIFSCEGHPHDFHVVFRGSYEIAHGLADVDDLVVSVFRSECHPEKNQWKIELSYCPDDREERDAALRQLADDMAKITI